MSVANLEAYALAKGIKTAYKDMDHASQVTLRYSYLMEKSKDAQGDFAKTLETSYANQRRLFSTNFSQKIAGFMSKSLPMLTKGYQLLNKFISGIDVDKLGDMVSDKLGAAFTTAEKYIPIVVDGAKKIPPILSDIYGNAKWISNLIINNWPMIEPIVWGITGAVIAWNMSLKAAAIIEGLTKAWRVGSAVMMMFQSGASLATVAQWGLNAAMAANPIGLVIVGIGALIAVGVLLYRNWETITSTVSGAWNWFKNLIKCMPDVSLALAGPLAPLLLLIKHFEKVKEVVGGAIDAVKKFFGYSRNNSGENDVSRQILVNSGMYTYASGGFANTPSIFGEAGLEAAIPIKYRNPRSISLLNQTAKAIGVNVSGREKPSIIINVYPTGGTGQEQVANIANAVKQAVKEALEEIQRDEERVAYGIG